MACYEYKITMSYEVPLAWTVNVFRREVLVYDTRGPWSCILHQERVPTLEGHLDPSERLRQVMRSLA